MKAGRKLNKLIHEKIFGYDLTGFETPKGGMIQNSWVHKDYVFEGGVHGIKWVDIPGYSESMDDAWKVVEWFRNQEGWEVQLTADHTFTVDIWEGKGNKIHRCYSHEMPHAICKAALKALGIDWKEHVL